MAMRPKRVREILKRNDKLRRLVRCGVVRKRELGIGDIGQAMYTKKKSSLRKDKGMGLRLSNYIRYIFL